MKRTLVSAMMTVILAIVGTAIADDASDAPYMVMEFEIVGQDFVGVVPKGLRLNGHTHGTITDGLLSGATVTGIDYLHYRPDGVGVIDVRAVAVHTDGVTVAMTMQGYLGEPTPGLLEALLDPEFEPEDVDIPAHGAMWFQTMAPQHAFLNHTVFGCGGSVNLIEGVVRITCRSLAP